MNYLKGPLFAFLVTVWIIGCQTASTVTELLLPTVVCRIISGKPASETYVRAISSALGRFTESGDLSSASLRSALVGVPISGVQPWEASALYGGVVLAYGALGEAFLTDPANKEQVLASLRSLQVGLASGLSQCGTPPSASAALARGIGPHDVTASDVQKLADAMARQLKR